MEATLHTTCLQGNEAGQLPALLWFHTELTYVIVGLPLPSLTRSLIFNILTSPAPRCWAWHCLKFRKFTQWSQWIYNPNNLLAWQEVSVKNVVLIRFLRWNHKILHLLPCLSGTSFSQTNPNRAWLMNFNSILTSPNQIKFSGMSRIEFCGQK